MENEHVKKRLSEYIDGALRQRDRDLIETHLATCADCSAEYSSLKAIKAALEELPTKNMPKDVEERLLSRLELGTPKRRPLLFKLATSPLAAVAAVIVIVASASLFTAKTPEMNMLTDEGRMEKSLAPPAEMDAGGGGKDDSNEMILADISDISKESAPSINAPNDNRQSLEALPHGSVDSLNQKKAPSSSMVVISSKDYSEDELTDLLKVDTFLPFDYDKQMKRLLEESKDNKVSLNNTLDVVKSRYANSLPLYAEKAKYTGFDAWFIIITDNNIKRLLVVKAVD